MGSAADHCLQWVQSNDEGLEKETTKVETKTGILVERQHNVVKATRPQGRYNKWERGKALSLCAFRLISLGLEISKSEKQ